MPNDPLRPPRPDLLALLDRVKDDPDDDTPRLVLADWLEEHGDRFDAERARFIRADVARGPSAPAPSGQAQRDRDDLMRRWLVPLADFISGWDFVRGLPHVTVHGLRFVRDDAPASLAGEEFAFVQFVKLTDSGGSRMEAMAGVPAFRHVPGLGVSPFSRLGSGSAARFFASPNLAGLRQIDFRSVQPGALGVKALADNPALARLRRVSLAHNKLVDKAAAALAGSPHLTGLQVLSLADNNIGDAGAESLAASGTLASLRELDLRDNPRLTPGGKQLLRDAFADRVKLN